MNAEPPPTEVATWTKCLVKLHLNNDHVSSIPVRRLLAATESNRVSYSTLCRFTILSAKFVKDGAKDARGRGDDKKYDVRLRYRDEDGDDVLFTSDVELMEALEWAAAEDDAATLHVFATVNAKGRPSPESTDTPEAQNSESPHVAICTPPNTSPPEIEKPTPPQQKTPQRDNPFLRFFRTGSRRKTPQKRHPDPPHNIAHIVIDGLANAIASAVTLIEDHQAAPPHGRRCSLASLQSETVGGGGGHAETVEPIHALRRADGDGYRRVVLVRAPDEVQKFDPKFVHKRHTCDGCKDFPIVGLRYHANPNVDLCQACYDDALTLPGAGESKETITFKLVQCRSDQCFVSSKLAHALLKFRKCLKDLPVGQNKIIPQIGPSSSASILAGYEGGSVLGNSTKVSDFDVAMAIQRSLHDLRKKQERLKDASPADTSMEKSLIKSVVNETSTDLAINEAVDAADHVHDAAVLSSEELSENEWCVVDEE